MSGPGSLGGARRDVAAHCGEHAPVLGRGATIRSFRLEPSPLDPVSLYAGRIHRSRSVEINEGPPISRRPSCCLTPARPP